MSITENRASYQEYRLICKENSIDFFNYSLESNNLPSRLGHVWVLLKASAAFPFSTLSRVLACCIVIPTNLIKVIIPINFDQKIYLLIEMKNELTHLISCIAIQFFRIGSSVIGVLSPQTAAKGWRLAEQIDAYCWRNKVDCESRFSLIRDCQSQESNEPARKPYKLPIRLFSPQLYLGTARVNAISLQHDLNFTLLQYNYEYTPPIGKENNVLSFGSQLHQETILW